MSKKKLSHIDKYKRTSYGKTHYVKSHYRGHHYSKGLPSDSSKYRAGGKIHKYSRGRDMSRRAKHTRKSGKASWRGDVKGGII